MDAKIPPARCRQVDKHKFDMKLVNPAK